MEELKEAFTPPMFSSEESRLQPGETIESLQERLGGMAKKLEPVEDKLIEGQGTLPTSITFNPALVAAKKMQKKVHDQLEESGANKQYVWLLLRLFVWHRYYEGSVCCK